jgi:hypothetical protein
VPDPASEGKAGRPKTIRKQVRHNAWLTNDEAGYVIRALDRRDATLGPILRSAWSGGSLGMANASVETSRHVEDFALGIVVGFQPSTTARIFEDIELGLPQRWLWCAAQTPWPATIPDNPGPMVSWAPPPAGTVLQVPAAVSIELRDRHRQATQRPHLVHPWTSSAAPSR